jgi:hypothetical protein
VEELYDAMLKRALQTELLPLSQQHLPQPAP